MNFAVIVAHEGFQEKCDCKRSVIFMSGYLEQLNK